MTVKRSHVRPVLTRFIETWTAFAMGTGMLTAAVLILLSPFFPSPVPGLFDWLGRSVANRRAICRFQRFCVRM